MNNTAGPLASVLIPCYDAGRWIGETLDSVLAQTWPNLEVIVVNDGSTDNSRAILDGYLSKGITVIDQPNRGQTAALNCCLAAAKGEFIQYLDADDLLAPDKIERQMLRLIEHPDCIATSEWARFQNDPAAATFTEYETWRDMDPFDWLVANWKDGGGMMYPAMWLVPRKTIDSIGHWQEDLTLINDTEYFTRAVLASRQVLFCNGARAYYRSGITGSLSGLKSRKGWESQFKVIDLCQGYLLSREDSDRTRRVCAMMWQRLAHGSYPYYRGLANRALDHARQLHRVRLEPEGGPAFRLASRMLGWKAARVLQRLTGRQ
jgi:glycosyltransferase involved in cell wall biosynthesis